MICAASAQNQAEGKPLTAESANSARRTKNSLALMPARDGRKKAQHELITY